MGEIAVQLRKDDVHRKKVIDFTGLFGKYFSSLTFDFNQEYYKPYSHRMCETYNPANGNRRHFLILLIAFRLPIFLSLSPYRFNTFHRSAHACYDHFM